MVLVFLLSTLAIVNQNLNYFNMLYLKIHLKKHLWEAIYIGLPWHLIIKIIKESAKTNFGTIATPWLNT